MFLTIWIAAGPAFLTYRFSARQGLSGGSLTTRLPLASIVAIAVASRVMAYVVVGAPPAPPHDRIHTGAVT